MLIVGQILEINGRKISTGPKSVTAMLFLNILLLLKTKKLKRTNICVYMYIKHIKIENPYIKTLQHIQNFSWDCYSPKFYLFFSMHEIR